VIVGTPAAPYIILEGVTANPVNVTVEKNVIAVVAVNVYTSSEAEDVLVTGAAVGVNERK